MFIMVPHQTPPRIGRDCITGDWDCESDCPGCRDLRDGHCAIGEPNTKERTLKILARRYRGHQDHRVHALAETLRY